MESYRVQYTQIKRKQVHRQYEVDHFSSCSFIELETRNDEQDGSIVEVRRRRTFLLRDAYMSFLLHLNEDFDDDLLLETVVLLDD